MKTTGMLMLLASLWSLPHPAGAQGLGDFQVIVAPEKTTRAILPLADEASRQYLAAMATIYNGGHSDRETPGLEL